jgi:hypothetical protein
MLTDEETEQMRRGLDAGIRGPVLIKWCEQLLLLAWLRSGQPTRHDRA